MPDIREARRRFSLALAILLAICVASAGILLSPIGNASRRGQKERGRLWVELRAKDRDVIPLHDIDGKVLEAKEEITGFYENRLPSSYASISEQLGKVASQSGVKLTTGRYQSEPAEIAGVQRIRIDAGISGDYLQTVKFINALERSRMFFLIDSVSLAEEQQAGAVRLQIHLETYLKNA